MTPERAQYLLSEIIGCYEEWKALPCTSLDARLKEAIARAEAEANKPTIAGHSNEKQARILGYRAGKSGGERTDNPYTDNPRLERAWRIGYARAKKQEEITL